jgi:hypothetical protein
VPVINNDLICILVSLEGLQACPDAGPRPAFPAQPITTIAIEWNNEEILIFGFWRYRVLLQKSVAKMFKKCRCNSQELGQLQIYN